MRPVVKLRKACESDFEVVIAIYNEAVATPGATADLEPVTAASRSNWFADHLEGRYPIWVAETAAGLAGWCSLSPYRPGRKALQEVAEISYYVAESHRRQGVATALIQHAIAACPDLGIRHLFTLVLAVNAPSLTLLARSGFEPWGRMPGVANLGTERCDHLIHGREV